MSTEFLLWTAGGLVGSVFLLTMMRRRQMHLIGLLTTYVQQQSDWARRRNRTQRLVAEIEKKNARKG